MNDPTQPRVLVTGGVGFIGSHLCDRLVETGADVLCVVNFYLYRTTIRRAAGPTSRSRPPRSADYFDDLLAAAPPARQAGAPARKAS